MKELIFKISDELAQKLELAFQLSGDERDAAAEDMVRAYLAKTFAQAAAEYRSPEGFPPPPPRGHMPPPPPPMGAMDGQMPPPPPPGDAPWTKADSRIPLWARKPKQMTHKILRAFFELSRELGEVTVDALRKRCSDPEGHPKTYVPHFDANFAQMKTDQGHSHGQVFEEKDGVVIMWDRVGDTLRKWRDYFE